jgi:hypothetical protein
MNLYSRILISLLLALAGAQAVWGASIGLFADPDCSSCNLTIPPGETRTLYIKVLAGSLTWQGAEFRITGLPEGWTAISTPNPAANLVLGDPFGNRANIAFDEVFTGDCTLLYTTEITATSTEDNVVLQVAAGDPPSSHENDFPLLVPGDVPCYCVYRADPGVLFINSVTECTVAIQPSTWSRVKQLYH